MGRLNGRVALITGGGRGIGRAIALEMARDGAMIVVAARTQAELDSVVSEAKALDSDGFAVVADAMDRDESRAPVAAAIERYGRLDILVNNVGGSVGTGHDPFAHEDDAFTGTLVLNLTSAYWTTTAALPHMREAGFGRVINIGSGYAKRSGGGLAYTTAKHGLIGFTRALAASAAPHGITVNCLCPGWTNTALVDWDRIGAARGISAERARAMSEADSLQNRILEPGELGPMAALLAAPESAGITGQVISVDGGYKV
jgi:meso-butanediol dehydrogenase/(S,S)-butanediol dehydrogenase/diacetyl reductase